MYLDHYGLTREPFHITPDPYFFYLSPSHKEALAALIYGLKNRKGFVSLTGEVGLGKTTVVRAFLNKWSSKAKIKTIFVFNSNLSFKGLLLTVFSELGLQPPYPTHSASGSPESSEQDQLYELVQTLHRALIQEFEQGYNVILVIDEAQNMPLQTLENLRMLSNLETTRSKLIQIFLIGQIELDRILDRKELRQLRQRIAVRATLHPLTRTQSKDYIHHRLQKAGAPNQDIFTQGALRKIRKYSQGVPRKINILADNALITGFGYGKNKIGSKIITEVQRDLQGKKAPRRIWRFALTCIVFLAILGAGLWLSPYRVHFVAGLQNIAPWSPSQSMHQEPEKASRTALDPDTDTEPDPDLQSGDQPVQEDVHNSTLQQPKEQSEIKTDVAPELEQQVPGLHEQDSQVPSDQQTTQEPTDSSEDTNPLPLPESEQKPENLSLHNQLADNIPAYSELSPTRQLVLIRMAKQTSIKGLLTFERMLAALEQEDFQEAARQMVNSRWARSVGEEAEELAEVMQKGEE